MSASEPLPLLVDLDGTLSRSDSLVDAIVGVLFRKPKYLTGTISAALKGRLALKNYLAEINAYSPQAPLRPEFVEWLTAEKSKGRELHLVTAAHQSVAEMISARLGLFATATGSSESVNLKGIKKVEFAKSRFPHGFAYAGNDKSDLTVWAHAQSAVIVGASAQTTRAAHGLNIQIEREFHEPAASLKTWLKAIRFHQWSKNVLLFVPLLLAQRYIDHSAVLAVVAGFICMGLVASATYLINDLSDLNADRQHRVKSRRGLASGEISVPQALFAASLLGLLGLTGAFLLKPAFGGLVVAYIVLTVAYSLRLKAVALLDVFVLGMLYTLRVFQGMILIGAPPAPWLLIFSMFFFFSLSTAKRHVEIVRAAEAGQTGALPGRGYRTSDGPLTLSMGISSSVASVLLLFLYVVNDAYPANFYKSPQWLMLISFFVFLWTTRIWLKSHRGKLDDDPVSFALSDPPSWLLGFLVALCIALAHV